MADTLRPFAIADLRACADGRRWQVDQPIQGLESLTPVRGELHALHHGTALELHGRAETILTLRCDRCLQHYNHRLQAVVDELLELSHDAGRTAAQEPPALLVPEGEELDDRLDPAGLFDPEHWLFEHLSLQLPLVNRCGPHCPGPHRWSSDGESPDPRWAPLATLQTPRG